MLWVSAMRNCVSNGVRTSRCRADFFRLSKSRCGLLSRRAPDRLAALLTAFRLSIAFCLRRAFTGGSDPAFSRAGPSPTLCPRPDLNRHIKPRLLTLSYKGMCGLPFARPLSSFVRYTAHSHTARRYLASGSVWWPCTLRRAVASERSALIWLYGIYHLAGAAGKVSPVRLYVADNGPYSAGCAPQSALWCRQQGLNLQAPGYEPGVLPLNYSDTIAGISASGRTIFRAAHMQDAGSVP